MFVLSFFQIHSRIIELLVMYEISFASLNRHCLTHASAHVIPDSKVHGANMGPTWVLSARDGPHVGPMNLAIRDGIAYLSTMFLIWWKVVTANQCGTIWKQKCYQTLQIMYCTAVLSFVEQDALKHYCDVIMSAMASQTPAYRVFAQPFAQAQIKENIKAPRYWLLLGNPPMTRGFP